VAVAAFYSARYHIDIGLHVFPTRKYQLVRERVAALSGCDGPPVSFFEPEPATWQELALVHTEEYLARLRAGTLSADEVAQ
jgi:acetoin utilization deacetylase AcuC-like enzyme